MYKKIGTVITAAMVMILMLSGSASAQDIKSRMRDRLPEIAGLKAKGIVGENNQGYLEILKGNGSADKIVSAENKDRRMVYEAIAAKTKTSIDVVGKRRAIQIAEKAGSGEWLQNTSGQWYKKP